MFIRSVALACALMCLAMNFETSSAAVKQKLFPIKGRHLENLADAATQLRHFLPTKLSAQQRCALYGITLDKFETRLNSLDYFDLTDIALMGQEKANAEFDKITFDKLRNLYMDGINSFREADHVNEAMVEIYRCLETNFKRYDPQALQFLNDPQLQETIEQYKFITSKPASLLISGQHPELRLEHLQRGVGTTVANWLAGGESELSRLFPSLNQQPFVPRAEARAFAEVGQQYPRHGVENVQQVQPVEELSQAPPVNMAKQGNDQTRYLADVSRAIVATYNSLTDETPLSATCEAYTEVIEASKRAGELEDPDLVRRVFAKVFDNKESESTPSKPFVPEASKRKNFLFVLQGFDLFPGSGGAWLDMAFCAREWLKVDNEANEFLNSQKFNEILDKIQPSVEPVPPAAPDQPAALNQKAAPSLPVVP